MTESNPSRGRGCAGFLAFCVVAGIVAGLVFTLWQRAQADDLRTRWHARGLPTSLAELDAWYEHVPDEENAALLFVAASRGFSTTQTAAENQIPYIGTAATPPYGVTLDSAVLATADAFIEGNAAAYELAHAAAQLPRSRYPFNGNLGTAGIDMQHLAFVRDVARHLWLETLVRAHHDDADGAIDSIEAAYALARSASGEPILIAQLVTVAVKQGTAQAASDAVAVTEFSSEQLDRLAALAADASGTEDYYRAIAGEAAFGLFDDSPRNPMGKGVFIFDRLTYARFIEAILDTSSLPLGDAAERIDAMASVRTDGLGRYLRPISSATGPAVAGSFAAIARGAIYSDLVMLVVAIEKYRLEHRVLPKALSDLVPRFVDKLEQDPYGSGPYMYLQKDYGYDVYSVGVDHLDGQGEKTTATGGDIPLRVTR